MPDKFKIWVAILILIIGISAFYYFSELSNFIRLVIFLIALSGALFIFSKTTLGKDTWDFLVEARIELRKVIWPENNETIQSTLVVMVMVVVMAVLMWFLDTVLLKIVRLLTGTES